LIKSGTEVRMSVDVDKSHVVFTNIHCRPYSEMSAKFLRKTMGEEVDIGGGTALGPLRVVVFASGDCEIAITEYLQLNEISMPPEAKQWFTKMPKQ